VSRNLGSLRSDEVRVLFRIFENLSRGADADMLRNAVADDLLHLFRSDFLASFIWDQEKGFFDRVVTRNMSPANLANYNSYYRHRDPITPILQRRKAATLVCEIMSQRELEDTEFFNDFLMVDGLHHGMNIYAYDGDLNIGDLRIWRAKGKPTFERRDAELLNLVLPHFRNALRNARVLSATQQKADLWGRLVENVSLALFLFNKAGQLVYRNSQALRIAAELPEKEYSLLYTSISSLAQGTTAQTEWNSFSLSLLRLVPPVSTEEHTAVMVHYTVPKRIDSDFLRQRYRLSPREIEISLLVCKGVTDPEIASALGVSFSTIRTHLKSIFAKLDVTTRSELIYVLLDGLVDISL